MNLPTINPNETMSSREIAELTGKRHDNVMRDIRTIITQLEASGEDTGGFIETTEKDGANRDALKFELIYSATMILISGYNAVLRSKIVHRWQQLEQQEAPALTEEQIVMQALTIQRGKIKALTSQVNSLAPKAKALDLIATADGSLNITEVAKTLQVRPKKLFDWLSFKKWIYRRVGGSGWVGYQDKIQQGLLEHKVITIHGNDGTDRVREQVRVTAKGLTKLADNFDDAAFAA